MTLGIAGMTDCVRKRASVPGTTVVRYMGFGTINIQMRFIRQ